MEVTHSKKEIPVLGQTLWTFNVQLLYTYIYIAEDIIHICTLADLEKSLL